VLTWKWPAEQNVQADAAAALYFPTAHSMQVSAASAATKALYFPPLHDVHTDAPL
jgi:hypothetical protein